MNKLKLGCRLYDFYVGGISFFYCGGVVFDGFIRTHHYDAVV